VFPIVAGDPLGSYGIYGCVKKYSKLRQRQRLVDRKLTDIFQLPSRIRAFLVQVQGTRGCFLEISIGIKSS
jgi:hypothetical protein